MQVDVSITQKKWDREELGHIEYYRLSPSYLSHLLRDTRFAKKPKQNRTEGVLQVTNLILQIL